MGSGCSQLFQPDKKNNTSEPIKIRNNNSQIHIISQQSSQNIFQQRHEIGQYLFIDDPTDNKINLQIEIWLKFLEDNQKIKNKQRNIPTQYFQTEIDQLIYCLYIQDPKNITQFLNEVTPSKIRQNLWKVILFPDYLYDPKLYSLLKVQKVNQNYIINMIKDLHRTFPYLNYFNNQDVTEKQGLEIGQQTLLQLLKVISLYFPAVGYTQGMNFLVAFLLIISGGHEEETFWSFVYLGKSPKFQILGFFEDGFPLAFFYLYIFNRLLEKTDPQLFKFINDLGLPDASWIYQWLTTLFLYSFPLQFVISIWDLIISRSLFFSIQISISILLQLKNIIYKKESMEFLELFQQIKENTDGMYDRHKEILYLALKNSNKIKLTKQQIQNYAFEFQQIQTNVEKEKKKRINHFYTEFYKQYKKKQKTQDVLNQFLIPSQNLNNIYQPY